jgi:hypothetical protein
MKAAGSLEFALARMHARIGRRPPETAWRAIEQSRDIAPILDLCRETSLQSVVRELPAPCDLHSVDHAVRLGWRRAVEDALAWMPPEYSDALQWCRLVPLLPAIAHLARGGEAAEWMRIDLDLADLCAAGREQRAERVKRGPLAPLAIVWNAPDCLPEAWTAEWQRRLPPDALDDTALACLAHDLERHLERFQDAGTHEAPQLRSELESRLLATFRRNALESAAVFAWLGLTALDLERLRGELARRLAFPRARLVT